MLFAMMNTSFSLIRKRVSWLSESAGIFMFTIRKIQCGIVRVLFILCCVISSFGCSSSDQKQINGKLLSLYPAITETIFLLEEGSQLSGRSDYCLFPEEVKSLPSFGTSLTPNYEAIALEAPRLVLTDKSMGTPVTELQNIAPLKQLAWLSAEDMSKSIVELGLIVNKPKEADELSEKIKTALQPKVTDNSPSVLIVMQGSDISKGTLWFIKPNTLHGSAIEAAGFRNAAPLDINGPPSMSVEQLLKQDPDIILFLASKKLTSDERDGLIKSLDVVSSLRAVQDKRIGVLNGDNLMGVGPKIIDLVEPIQTIGKSLLDGN